MVKVLANIFITVYDVHRSARNLKVSVPNECPWCHDKISPTIISGSKTDIRNNRELQYALLLRCTSCYKHFIQSYDPVYRTDNTVSEGIRLSGLELNNSQPKPKSTFSYPSEIDKISTEFKNIISQSTEAEGLGFNHLAGIGFRKSLEFLVKDFLINFKSLNQDKISKKTLSQCIQQDIEDPRIKSLAEAATWIGNDETHYVRKHEDHTINDMKRFLHAMTYYISLEVSISDAEELTNK